MAGGYDLYGTYYPNLNDAINAEMTQCNEIDNAHLKRKISELERRHGNNPNPEVDHLWEYIKSLEKRISKLESEK